MGGSLRNKVAREQNKAYVEWRNVAGKAAAQRWKAEMQNVIAEQLCNK